jgi:uncharacterized alpha-E superfamily protein
MVTKFGRSIERPKLLVRCVDVVYNSSSHHHYDKGTEISELLSFMRLTCARVRGMKGARQPLFFCS